MARKVGLPVKPVKPEELKQEELKQEEKVQDVPDVGRVQKSGGKG